MSLSPVARSLLLAWLSTRLILVLLGLPAATGAFAGMGLAPPPHYSTTPDSPFLAMWARWDAAWYLDIATRGYTAPLPDGTYDMRPNFFPALPILIKVLAPVVGAPAAGILVANLSFLAALAFLGSWAAERINRTTASRLIWIYAAFPTSFFFSAVYAESLLLAGIAAAWWGISRRRWHLAGLALFVAVLARPTGLIAASALILAGLADGPAPIHLRTSLANRWPIVVWPACALALYLVSAQIIFGDALATVRTQEATRAPATWPWVAFIAAFRDGLYWNSYTHPLFDGIVAAGAILALPFVMARLGWRQALLASVLVIVPLSSGLISFSRLVLPAFPLFVLVASDVKGWTFTGCVAGCFALQAFLFTWFAASGWVA